MSALTKIFVVLLVVCSLLLSAAVVVFVNKAEVFKADIDKSKAALVREQADRAAADADLVTARANLQSVQAQMQGQINQLRTELANAEKLVTDKDQQLADKTGNITALTLAQQRLTEALKASEQSRGQVLASLGEAQKLVDDLSKKRSELNAANSDLANRLDQATYQLRNAMEDLKASQDKLSQYVGLAKTHNLPALDEQNPPPPALKLTGVVEKTQNLNGVAYATISVGAEDGVTKGMKFEVVNTEGNGEWLGSITIDTVDQKQASGPLKLKGPVMNQIVARQTQVRTQL